MTVGLGQLLHTVKIISDERVYLKLRKVRYMGHVEGIEFIIDAIILYKIR